MPTLPSDKKILRPSPSLIKLKAIITIPNPHLLFQIHIPAYSSKFTSPPTPPDSPPRLLVQNHIPDHWVFVANCLFVEDHRPLPDVRIRRYLVP